MVFAKGYIIMLLCYMHFVAVLVVVVEQLDRRRATLYIIL